MRTVENEDYWRKNDSLIEKYKQRKDLNEEEFRSVNED